MMKILSFDYLPDLGITEIIGGTLVDWFKFMMRTVDKYQRNMASTVAMKMMMILTTLVRNHVS